MLSVCKEIKLLWLFYPGFIGVDIFLFLSGYGLSQSWEKNTVATFYIHRLKRILPMFLCFQGFISVWQNIFSPSATYFDTICNFTTLSFWGFGGWPAEWYLSFLLYLYLLFPLFYKLASRLSSVFTLTLLLTIVLLQYAYDWSWNKDAAFSRVPIFVMGIVCYMAKKEKNKLYCQQMVFFTISMLLFVWMLYIHKAEKYEIVYMFAPCFMLLASVLSKGITADVNKIHTLFVTAGEYSLELYVANMVTLSVVDQASLTVWQRLLFYLMLQVVLSYVMIVVNRIIKLNPHKL